MKLDWLFFDIGSTLVDESVAYEHRVRDSIRNHNITYEMFIKKREEFASKNIYGDVETMDYFHLIKAPWCFNDEKLYPDALFTIVTLYKKGYKIGVIANQALGTKERLQLFGLSGYIDIISSSAELRIEKPDEQIFIKSLEAAHCSPQSAVMIGDRIDNDIIPAQRLGMKTVWVRQGYSRLFNVDNLSVHPDYIIESLSELIDIF